jgi:hypothetical protein
MGGGLKAAKIFKPDLVKILGKIANFRAKTANFQ